MTGSGRTGPPGAVRLFAAACARGWWLLLALVVLGVWSAVTMLPSLTASAGGSGLSFADPDAPAIRAQAEAAQLFGLPVLTRIAVVQHDPAGVDPATVRRAVDRALEVSRPALDGRPQPPLLFAVPLVDGAPVALPPELVGDAVALGRAFTDVRLPAVPDGPTTTVVTYLFVDPTTNPFVQQDLARAYAASLDAPGSPTAGFSGQIPFQLEQGNVVNRNLRAVEIASVLAVALVVGLTFRSVLAPVVTLLTAGASYLVADHVVGYVAQLAGVSAPGQLQPVLVALALGVSTDYSILYLAGARRRLRQGARRSVAARSAVEDYLTIILVAGLTVTAGVAALGVAETSAFRAFGPGLALTVFCTLVVSVLLVPPLLVLLGRWAFWPGLGRAVRPIPADMRAATEPDEGPARDPGDPEQGRSRFVGVMIRRRGVAATTVVLAALVLGAATLPLANLQLAVSPMSALPEGNPVRATWEDAAAGFAPGILSPTELVVRAPGVVADREAILALENALAAEPGVAGVLGPGIGRIPPGADVPVSLFSGPRGDTVRLLVVLDADPAGGQAISDLRDLRDRMPALLAGAGLGGAQFATAGDTAIALGIADSVRSDFLAVATAVALVDLLLLVIFLRALVAPLFLLACSALVVGASLGLTSLVFGELAGDGLIFFVPFAVGALLASLGSDYAVFGIGDVWRSARSKPLAEALAEAVPRSSRAISAAGITLAVSFGLVAIVPLDSFHQLAFAMAVGVLIDTFLIRPVVVPALVWWIGPASAWPGHRLESPDDRVNPAWTRPRGRGRVDA